MAKKERKSNDELLQSIDNIDLAIGLAIIAFVAIVVLSFVFG